MFRVILESLYLFLPAFVANMAPVVARWLNSFPKLAVPIDGSTPETVRPIFGTHKTYRGLVVGLFSGIVAAFLQKLLADYSMSIREITLFPFANWNFLWWGLLLSGGALGGDLVKSFVKRRMGISAGARWVPWDQLDQVFGGILFGSFAYSFSLENVLALIVLTPPLVLAINFLGYIVHVKENW